MDHHQQQQVQFPIDVDVQAVSSGSDSKAIRKPSSLKPLFNPKQQAIDKQLLKVDDHQLGKDELWRYALLANEVRLKLLQQAKELDDAME